MSLGNETTLTMPVAPAYMTGGNCGNSMWGGDWSSWIILFLIFGMFGGGWGGGFGGFGGGANSPAFQAAATRADINEGFALNDIQNGIRGIQQGICDSTYALNNSITGGFHDTTVGMMQGFNGVNSALCTLGYNVQGGFNTLGHQISDCCCTTQRAIDGVRYDMATQACDTRNVIQNSTRDILESNNANTRAILDFLTQDKISTLTAENQALKFQASQTAQNAFITANQEAQTATLLRRLGADCPTPAYVVQPPTPVTFPTNACGQVQFASPCGCGC